jgi:hypothetical protein
MASPRLIQTVSLPHLLLILLAGLAASFALHCASSTQFVSSWRSPTAQPLQYKGANVVAVVMMRNAIARKDAEDTLAKEISALGAHGIPMYQLQSDGSAEGETAARKALEGAGRRLADLRGCRRPRAQPAARGDHDRRTNLDRQLAAQFPLPDRLPRDG